MPTPETVRELTESLLSDIEAIPSIPGLTITNEGEDLRENLLRILRVKVLPELQSGAELPVFVGVQGGTNVGKSTVLNALCGKLLSPAIVEASATKHPLVYAHERWKQKLIDPSTFPELECRELEDPKELIVDAARVELLYFRFHRDDALERIAIIDSPDFDSVLDTNLHVARNVTALSDVTVFVTTQQKYRDRVLVEWLRAIGALKAKVRVAFNMVDEDIVLRTLADDLLEIVSIDRADIRAFRLGRSSSPHPEDEVGATLEREIAEELRGLKPDEIKPVILGRTLGRLVDQTLALTSRFAAERAVGDSLAKFAEDVAASQADEYHKSFELALPEETLAVRRAIEITEIHSLLLLSKEVAGDQKALGFITQAIRGFNDTVRRIFGRLSGIDEGSIGESDEDVESYAKARNDSDFERVLRLSDTAQLEVESYLREREATSPLAREILGSRFSTESRSSFGSDLRVAFDAKQEEIRESSGQTIHARVEDWSKRRPVLKTIGRGAGVGRPRGRGSGDAGGTAAAVAVRGLGPVRARGAA